MWIRHVSRRQQWDRPVRQVRCVARYALRWASNASGSQQGGCAAAVSGVPLLNQGGEDEEMNITGPDMTGAGAREQQGAE